MGLFSGIAKVGANLLGVASNPTNPVNKFLGSNVGKQASSIGGAFVSNYMDQRKMENNFGFLEDKGLTPQEIAGGGGGGKAASSGNTLGSGPATELAAQQKLVVEEKAKDRAHDLEKIEAAKEVPRRQVAVSEGNLALQQNLNPEQKMLLQRNIAKVNVEIQKAEKDLTYYWEVIFAKMGPENVKAALAAFASGVSLRHVLMAQGTEEQREAAAGLYRDLIGSGSRFTIEKVGITEWIKGLFTGQGLINNTSNPSETQQLFRKEWEMFNNKSPKPKPAYKRSPRTNNELSNPLNKKFWSR